MIQLLPTGYMHSACLKMKRSILWQGKTDWVRLVHKRPADSNRRPDSVRIPKFLPVAYQGGSTESSGISIPPLPQSLTGVLSKDMHTDLWRLSIFTFLMSSAKWCHYYLQFIDSNVRSFISNRIVLCREWGRFQHAFEIALAFVDWGHWIQTQRFLWIFHVNYQKWWPQRNLQENNLSGILLNTSHFPFPTMCTPTQYYAYYGREIKLHLSGQHRLIGVQILQLS